MTRYYKAVTADGRDFATGMIDYVAHLQSGELVRPGVTREDTDLGHSGLLHAAKYPPETLNGGSAAGLFRLLAVEGHPFKTNDASSGFREYGFTELRVVEELPIADAFGPDGDKVVRVLSSPIHVALECPVSVPNFIDPPDRSRGPEIDTDMCLQVLASYHGDPDRPLDRPLSWIRARFAEQPLVTLNAALLMLAHRLPENDQVLRAHALRLLDALDLHA